VPSVDKPTLCVVNYNGAHHLRQALPQVIGLRDDFAEILLVDNASTDDSLAYVRSAFPEVRILALADNLGPGAARNAGLREAASDLVLFADNDVSPAPGCAAFLAEALIANPDAAVATPRVLYAHDRAVIQYDGGVDNHFLGLMILYNQDCPLPTASEPVRRTDSVITACFMVHRGRLGTEDAFDESFFIYYEDQDFGMRVRLRGFDILSVPDAHCFHGEGTEGLALRRTGTYAPRRVFLLVRNRWLLLLKNYSLRSIITLFPVLLAFEICQLAIVVKKGWLKPYGEAVAWVWGNRGTVLDKRRRVQGGRKVADRVLLRGGPVPFRQELTTSGVERALRRAFDVLAVGYWRVVGGML
jgi:GT2 family glycosyltransferase